MSEEKTYLVRRPFAGVVNVEVEAESEEEARQKATDAFQKLTIDWKSDEGVDVEEWNVYDRLFQGNISYVNCYEEDIEELDY